MVCREELKRLTSTEVKCMTNSEGLLRQGVQEGTAYHLKKIGGQAIIIAGLILQKRGFSFFLKISGLFSNHFILEVRHERDAEIAEIKRDIAMQKRRWKPVYRYFAAYLWSVDSLLE
jgi:hypothetical protein